MNNKHYKLYATTPQGKQVILFSTIKARRKFLTMKRMDALKEKRQLLYKGTEYLRIYNNCTLYQEYDIQPRRIDSREQAEQIFRRKS